MHYAIRKPIRLEHATAALTESCGGRAFGRSRYLKRRAARNSYVRKIRPSAGIGEPDATKEVKTRPLLPTWIFSLPKDLNKGLTRKVTNPNHPLSQRMREGVSQSNIYFAPKSSCS